jgi:hypothetical protein
MNKIIISVIVLLSLTSSSYAHLSLPGQRNDSHYGEISERTHRPKTENIDGYYRQDGTYVKGHYRSRSH